MYITLWGDVTLIEFIWTFIAFGGLIYSMMDLAEAHFDRKALTQANMDGHKFLDRVIVANGAIRTHFFRIIQLTLFALIGLWAMTTSPAIRENVRTAQQFSGLGLVVAAGMTTASARLDRHDRIRVFNFYKSQDEKEGTNDPQT